MSRPPFDLIVKRATLVLNDGEITAADIGIAQGKIAAIGDGCVWQGRATLDATGLIGIPGAIDAHTHWASTGDFSGQCSSDSAAALIGGTTTANVLHRTAARSIQWERSLAKQNSYVDFAIRPSVTSPHHVARLESMLRRESAVIKFFLAYMASPHAHPGDGWNELTTSGFEQSLRVMGESGGCLAFVHAEDAHIIQESLGNYGQVPDADLQDWSRANPPEAEVAAIEYAARIGRQHNVPMYFVHLSSSQSLDALRRVRGGGGLFYGETCPHYLVHDTMSSTAVKFSPPVRERCHQEALWRALEDGTLDTVGSDNSTTRTEEKVGPVWEIRRGGPNAGLLLPLVLSEGVAKGRLSLQRAVEVTSTNAARILGLYPRKGTIAVGSDADLVFVDFNAKQEISPALFGNSVEYTLFDGIRLQAWPELVLRRGELVVADGTLAQKHPPAEDLGIQQAVPSR